MAVDGTEVKVDSKTSPEVKGTPKQETPATFTKEQVDAQISKARSDALADVGRLRKESENAVKMAQAAQARLDRLLKEQDEAELNAAKSDPEKLTALQERQARRKAESELEQARRELEEKNILIKQIDEEKASVVKEKNAHEIATRLGVDESLLLKLSKHVPADAIEEIANNLPKKETKPKFVPDSGGTLGASATPEQIRDAFVKNPYDQNIRQRYLELRKTKKK